MADQIVEQIGKDPNFIKSVTPEYEKFNSMSLISKAEASKKLFVNFRKYKMAPQIASDTIYEQIIENNELKDKLTSYGDYNEQEINQNIQSKILNSSNVSSESLL